MKDEESLQKKERATRRESGVNITKFHHATHQNAMRLGNLIPTRPKTKALRTLMAYSNSPQLVNNETKNITGGNGDQTNVTHSRTTSDSSNQ